MNVTVNTKCQDCDKKDLCKYLETIHRFVYSAEHTEIPFEATLNINCTYYRYANSIIQDPLSIVLDKKYGGAH